MKTNPPVPRAATAALLVCLLAALAACGGSKPGAAPSSAPPSTSPATSAASVPASPPPSEKAATVDSAAPGDIPDTQAFVAFRSDAGHFTLQVPEGWAQQAGTAGVTFTSTVNAISVVWKTAPAAPTAASAGAADVPQLQGTERAFQLGGVKAVTLPAGGAVEITYQANGAPNPVTGKQYRMDVQRFELYRGGTQVVLTLSSPVGADNVDPWAKVSRSFAWL